MKRSELDAELNAGHAVFPEPPSNARSFIIRIDRIVSIKAGVLADRARVSGRDILRRDPDFFSFMVKTPIWVPDSEKETRGTGTWRRTVRLEATFIAQGLPSFKSDLIPIYPTTIASTYARAAQTLC
jgi:hypothetical protein